MSSGSDIKRLTDDERLNLVKTTVIGLLASGDYDDDDELHQKLGQTLNSEPSYRRILSLITDINYEQYPSFGDDDDSKRVEEALYMNFFIHRLILKYSNNYLSSDFMQELLLVYPQLNDYWLNIVDILIRLPGMINILTYSVNEYNFPEFKDEITAMFLQ